MAQAPSIAEIGTQRFGRWLLACVLTSTLSFLGLAFTVAHPGRHPVVFAFGISWCVALAVSALTRDSFLGLDPKRFRFARWEREGRIYESLGISWFGWLLGHSPAGWLNPYLRLTSGRSGLERLLREMSYAEGAHIIGGGVTVALGIWYWYSRQGGDWSGIVGYDSLFHVYPVMLQRWNRGRVLQVIRRLEGKNLGAN